MSVSDKADTYWHGWNDACDAVLELSWFKRAISELKHQPLSPASTGPVGAEKSAAKEFLESIFSACDASNWDADLNKGDYFRGLNDAYEAVHEIAADYQSSIYDEAKRLASLLAGAGREKWQPTHRHVKRGSLYQVIGKAFLQTETGLMDMSPVIIYRAEDGSLWVRGSLEFDDGRFEPLPAAPLSPSGDRSEHP